jgi:hypothetical protein
MIKRFIENNWVYAVVIVMFSMGVSYFIPFVYALCVFTGILITINIFLRKQTNEEFEMILQDADRHFVEQEEVIKEYEKIFDSLVIPLDCICGGNTFEGLFQPNVENIVECEKCNSKYKVMVSYDSILISEPGDLDVIQKEITNKIEQQ